MSKKMKSAVTFHVTLPINIKKEGKHYISWCPVLDVCSQGKTEAAAKKNIAKASQLFLINCYERGNLDKVLKECGFAAAKRPLPRKKQSQEEIIVRLPFVIDSQMVKCQG
jgi:predicted RNase H-like HicB family nuclease